ncbi:MAG TPA: diacylglycerol kinase family protein [Trebonia sp.]|nr:diacylglycerol kinase family protein [Trebonia sp.]
MPAVEFIINGTLARASRHIRSLCGHAARRANWESRFVVTEKVQAGIDAAHDAAVRGADLVVAVGGDGTVRGCAEGLADSPVPLGIVPLGTANLLARTLGIPLHPEPALGVALAATAASTCTHRRIDLATADDAPFTAMAGMGLDAAVVAATRLKHHLGWLAYAISGAAHLAASPATFTIRLDKGQPFARKAHSVVVGNSGLLPGGFTLLPDAQVDDGLLDVCVLAPHGPLGWPRVATRVLTHSRAEDHHLERFQAREVTITAHRPLPREVDGEVVTPGSALNVRIRRAALTVRVPAGR